MKNLIFCLLIIIIIVGCQSKTNDETNLNLSRINELDIDKDIKEIAIDSYASLLPTSSNDKISEAYEQNEISKEEWVLLTFISSYIPEELPKQFKGNNSATWRNQLQEARWWLNENYNDLDDKWKEAFEPFYVLPDDPRSISNINKKTFLDKISIIPLVIASNGWYSFESEIMDSKRKVKIIYQSKNKEKASWANQSMYDSWFKFEALLGTKIDETVYLYVEEVKNADGEAYLQNVDGAKRCIIRVSSNMGEKKIKSTAVHELFHCFQFYIPLEYKRTDNMWLMEATAAWSEDYIYEDYNVEWEYLPYQFKNLHTHMIEHNGEKEYSSYLWYLFLEKYTGDDGYISRPLNTAKTSGGRKAATSMKYFDTLFAEYSLWLWNKEPLKRFTDLPDFPTKYRNTKMNPQGVNLYSREYSTKKTFSEFDSLKALSSKYMQAIFSNDDIKKVVYKFEELGNEQHRRQAIIKIGDSWHVEDWTHIKERIFCREEGKEPVKTVILVLSNSRTENTKENVYDEFFELDTRGECKPQWQGYTKWHYSDTWTDEIDAGALFGADKKLSTSSTYSAYETLVYDEQRDRFSVKDMYLSYQKSEIFEAINQKDCATMNKIEKEMYSGALSKSWDINKWGESSGPTRITANKNDPLKYDVNLGLVPGEEFITYISTTSKFYNPCPLEGISKPPAGESSTESYFAKLDSLSYNPNKVTVNISEDGNRIQGTFNIEGSSRGNKFPIYVEVDYKYS